jgi:phosphohistidine phosphatase
MKQIFLIRHAKSSWANSYESDFSRPLNERGKHDGEKMAELFSKRKIKVDLILCSAALRTRQTATYFSEALGFPKKNISFLDELYHASSETIYATISKIKNEFVCVIVICHNPGITNFVNTLTDAVQIDNMPTCGIFGVESHNEDWNEFETSEKNFLVFDYPKLH